MARFCRTANRSCDRLTLPDSTKSRILSLPESVNWVVPAGDTSYDLCRLEYDPVTRPLMAISIQERSNMRFEQCSDMPNLDCCSYPAQQQLRLAADLSYSTMYPHKTAVGSGVHSKPAFLAVDVSSRPPD